MSGGGGFAERWSDGVEDWLCEKFADQERSRERAAEFSRSAIASIEDAGHAEWPPIDAECNVSWVNRPVANVIGGRTRMRPPAKGTKRPRWWGLRQTYEAAERCGATIPEPLNAVDDGPADIRTVLANWQPRSMPEDDVELVAGVRPTLEEWVVRAEPRDAHDARFLMLDISRMAAWTLRTLNSASKEVVLNERNAQRCLEAKRVSARNSGCGPEEMKRLVARHRKALSAVGRVGRTVNPDGWAVKPPSGGSSETPPPYTQAEEYAFQRAISRVRNTVRAERLWTGGALLGGGLSGPETTAAWVEHVTVDENGGLVVEVRGKNPRFVPILRRYESLVRQAMDAAISGPFITTTRKSPVSGIAANIEVDGNGLSLTRARSTWLRTHLSGGTPIGLLRAIAGPVSSDRLDALLSDAAASLDPLEAARKALGL